MALVNKLSSIADAIRSRTGDTSTLTLDEMPVAISGIKSGGGSQADWNQNDETAADYIKNRPFYTTDPKVVDIVPEETVTFSDQGGIMAAPWPSNVIFTAGYTYHVKVDGVDYECIAKSVKNLVLLGNLSLAGISDNNTGEPFVILPSDGSYITAHNSTATEHVMSISTITEEDIKIPERYLPVATEDNPGISKTVLRVLDINREYTTEEIKKICEEINSGSVLYKLYKNYIRDATLAYDYSYVRFYTTNSLSQYTEVTPTDGVWVLNNTAEETPIHELNLSNSGKVLTLKVDLITDSAYGFRADDFGPDGGAYGFRGKYIAADKSLILCDRTDNIYYHISADNGKLSVKSNRYNSYVNVHDTTIFLNGEDSLILKSSTPDSTKKFKITVDDSGTISATEVTS